MRMRLAFSASFSQARASICSACTLVRWGGVGRYKGIMIQQTKIADLFFYCGFFVQEVGKTMPNRLLILTSP